MPRNLADIRNLGIIAHIDAGKTTVTERMLYYAGATHKMGEVDKGTTTTDFDPEEQQRGITIYAAAVTFPWKGKNINLIDTPGHVDFTAEVERSLRVLDGAVIVFSAREGVEAQSETVWRQADKYHVPRLAFINKLDREGADFQGTFDEIKSRLGVNSNINPVAIQMPIGAGPPHLPDCFRGIVDLIDEKLLTFTGAAGKDAAGKDLGATVSASEIPEELKAEAAAWRARMLEELFNYNDELAALVLGEEPVPPELIRQVIRSATLSYRIVPVLCGSALDYQGIQPLLDAVAYYLPSPLDVPPVEGVDPKNKDKKLIRKSDPDEPFCGLLFKIVADKHGDLCYVRVYSGTLKPQSRLLNPRDDKRENVAQLWQIFADDRKQVQEVGAGDIVGIIGLKSSVTGDTLCDAKAPIALESITFPETVISMAIEPESTAERKKLADVLEMLKRQDPTFRAKTDEETGQTHISGMGELHLEIIKNRLLRDFNLNVKVFKPRVSYRETVERAAEALGECHKVQAGQQMTADVKVRLEPYQDGDRPVTVASELPFETTPPAIVAAVEETLAEQSQGFTFPLIRVKVTALSATTTDASPNEVAFRMAAADAFQKALTQAKYVLLEPIMKVEVVVPEEYLGDIVGDLQQRRAIITGTTVRGKNTVIDAEVPLASMFGYSGAMRSKSQGRASCSMEPFNYAPAPPDVANQYFQA